MTTLNIHHDAEAGKAETDARARRQRRPLDRRRGLRILTLLSTPLALAWGATAVAAQPAAADSAVATQAASATSLYAYALGGAAPSAKSCRATSKASAECSLGTALALAKAGETVYLATAGDVASYVGNFSLDPTGTSTSEPVTIKPAHAGSDPTLDGDASGTAACTTAACDGSVLTMGAGVHLDLDSVSIVDADDTTGNGGGIDDDGVLSLRSVTVNGTEAAYGGAVYLAKGASLSASGSTFSDDTATNDDGGAIDSGDGHKMTGKVTLTNCTFVDDVAFHDGGAVASGDHGGKGTTVVTDSSFSDDTTANGYGDGGAIDSADNAGTGTLTVTESTFTDDVSSLDGGAVDSGDNAGTGVLAVSGSTFSGDQAGGGGNEGGNGGGVNVGAGDSDDTLTIAASTFYYDSVASLFGDGGAIADDNSGGTNLLLDSTIYGTNGTNQGAISALGEPLEVAGTIVADSMNGDCSGSITDGGYNLDDESAGQCGFSAADHDLVGVNPDLGALQDNGGETQTMLPEDTSPAIGQIPDPTTVDVGSTTAYLCPVTDQRGEATPDNDLCSIGAVDVAAPSLVAGSQWTLQIDNGTCFVETLGSGGTWSSDAGFDGTFSTQGATISESWDDYFALTFSGVFQAAQSEYAGTFTATADGSVIDSYSADLVEGALSGC